jgi:predicted short-subunit dehydrogenase-like oxidoreductase (DUF2520 family)
MIGSGNVATVLARKLQSATHQVLQVFSKTSASAQRLAEELNCEFTIDKSSICQDADIYIIAVNDGAIGEIAEWLRLDRKLTVHTAGSVSKQVLINVSKNYGVLYPLQSLRREMTRIPEIPFLVDGNTPDDLALITDLAHSISTQVKTATDEQRLHFHLSAVIVSNFTNHLYALTQQFCINNQLDFGYLHPLILEVAERLKDYDPARVQTGPAIRNDQETIQKHLNLLSKYPELKNIYQQMSASIRLYHQDI